MQKQTSTPVIAGLIKSNGLLYLFKKSKLVKTRVVWFCFFITKRCRKTMPLWRHYEGSWFLEGRKVNAFLTPFFFSHGHSHRSGIYHSYPNKKTVENWAVIDVYCNVLMNFDEGINIQIRLFPLLLLPCWN